MPTPIAEVLQFLQHFYFISTFIIFYFTRVDSLSYSYIFVNIHTVTITATFIKHQHDQQHHSPHLLSCEKQRTT